MIPVPFIDPPREFEGKSGIMPLCHNAAKVGALLFATAQSIYECTEDVRPAVGDACPSQMCITVSNSQGEEGRKEVELTKTSSHDADENRLEDLYPFDPPKNFETAPSFPDNLILQFRRMPNEEGELISCVPGVQRGATIVATGQVGQYLQTQVGPQQASERNVWVPRVLDGLVLFVEKSDPAKVDKEAEAEHPAGSTEEAILEQQDQVQRFQSWWAEGQGMVGARSHPMLSILDATVLGDIIAAGANYHNCLSADRLDTLQRHVSKSSAPGLDALRRALQAKGGAKSQARAVGSVFFKEAMDMFKHPPSDLNRASPALAASPGESQGEQPGAPSLEQARPNACVVADEIFDAPKRFVCSESFPPEATVAVRLEPNKASSLVTSLPYGSDVLATAARGTYLQFKLEKSQEHGDFQHVWVPRVLDGLVLFVEKSDPAKVDKEAEAEHPAGSTEEAILEQQDQVQRFQSWWAEGQGMVGARSHPMLSILDATVLGDIIAAGANYHNCLSADRLDTLQRHVSKSSAPGLDALRRALQAKGGAKSQARAVGSVIFKEAMDMFKHPPSDLNRASPALAASPGESQGEQPGAPSLEQARPNACVVADEIFDPPKRFVCSESFPPEATVAVRLEPNKASSLVTSLPYGSDVLATAARGTYLQFKLEKSQEHGDFQHVWVPRVLDGLVLFVEKSDPAKVDKEAEAEHPAGSTEEAILEQQDQVQRFQSWWAEGQGMVGARSHPMLSILDATVLGDIIAAGANYHNCLSADRLDTLQRHVSKSSAPGLDALRRALQAKGGAKSQARAVGSVIFKEAMDMFKHPPSDLNRASPALAASPGESQGEQPGAPSLEQARPNACVVADEIFDPPKRFVCSESFPPEATVAVRLEPNKASSLVTSLPYGSDVLATAARGTYLQFKLEKSQEHGDFQHVWVPRVLDGLVLFVEKSDPAKVDKEAEAEHPAGSTEEAILEQQDQVQRFQSWWAEGKGMVGARSHPMLSILDATVLGDIIAAGANYHNCLSADRLDTLQRHVSKSSAPGLDALRRALQAKGGAKSQARAVGSVIFKEAMDMFKHPPSDLNRASPALAASPGESQGEQPGAPSLEQARPNACVVADEIFDPPKRFVCSESFPPEATVAVRSAPSHQSEYLTCLPHGTVSWLQLSNGSMCTLSCFFRGKLVRLTIRRGDYVQWSLW